MDRILIAIKAASSDFQPVGSRVTCRPAPTGTDIDYLVLNNEPHRGTVLLDMIDSLGFEEGGSIIPEADNHTPAYDRFASYTLGEINLIVTKSRVFFDRFMAATSVATRLNLLDKPDRIALFRAVLYAEPCEPSLAQLNDAAAYLEAALNG